MQAHAEAVKKTESLLAENVSLVSSLRAQSTKTDELTSALESAKCKQIVSTISRQSNPIYATAEISRMTAENTTIKEKLASDAEAVSRKYADQIRALEESMKRQQQAHTDETAQLHERCCSCTQVSYSEVPFLDTR